MTPQHFRAAANLVDAIRQGSWTHELPDWAPADVRGLDTVEVSSESTGNVDVNIVRAVWTAEAFIILARAFNPSFNERLFLRACGLEGK